MALLAREAGYKVVVAVSRLVLGGASVDLSADAKDFSMAGVSGGRQGQLDWLAMHGGSYTFDLVIPQ